jgi:antitoxin component YwqK of YwqJK toxin-antitoxin module
MPWSQVNCDAGVEDGSYHTYHPNGEPAIEGTYSGGQRTGTWRFFSPEGALLDTKEVTNLDE